MAATCFAYTQTGVAKASTDKAPYSGGSIKDAVFYIAVDGDGDGITFDSKGVPTEAEDAIYYYTYADIKAAGEEVTYTCDNHGVTENDSVKGVRLKSLLDDTTGITYNDAWEIQYMEDDAYHATNASYQDTYASLSSDDGTNPIIGYASKTTYDNPDANNVNDTTYSNFIDYSREASYLRVYRQTGSANSTIMKMTKGVVISPNTATYDGEDGYTVKSVDSEGTAIADDYQVLGFIPGMKWEAAPKVGITWATIDSGQSGNFDGFAKQLIIGDGDYATATVNYKYTEDPFLSVYRDGKTTTFKRSNIATDASELPGTNVKDGVTYTYFGWNKPMYVRYEGKSLDNYVSAPSSGEKVYIRTENGNFIDITNRIDDFFVAYYWSQSKSSTNISNNKRVPLNYDYSVLVDSASAPVEYSNTDDDYTSASGKAPTTYENAQIVVAKEIAAPVSVSAASKGYKSIKISWSKGENASGYQIYRATSKTGTYKKIKTISSGSTLSYVNTKLKTGKRYYYKVKTVGEKGLTSSFSAAKSSIAKLGRTSGLKVRKSGSNIVVKWSKVSKADGYQVYRATKKSGKYTRLKTLKGTRYTSVNPGSRTYYYKVRAYINAGSKKVYGNFSTVKRIKL